MAVAADLTEAALNAVTNGWVVHLDAGRTLKDQLLAWMDALAAELDPGSTAERTALNWVPIMSAWQEELPTLKADEDGSHANETGIYLHRSCRALEYAANAGRITGAQSAALLAQYNAIWT